MGALYAMEKYEKNNIQKLHPIDKIELALETAEYFSSGVKSPFNIISI